MPSNFNIRVANEADIPKISEYYRELYKGDEEQEFFGSKLSYDDFRAGQRILVAESDNKIVGYLWFVWYEHIKNKGVAYFEEVYVDEKHRASGIGKALIEHAIDEIRSMGIKTIYLAVGAHMKDSQEFYKHIGFEISHEVWFEKML
ncbi:MAG: GNAT family N-acetyltransferase [Candidatus Micrarchaeaceae archaeon]